MSCDANRHKYFAISAEHKAVVDTFGTEAEATTALEQIFNLARSNATTGDRAQTTQAEARTRKLFDEMKAMGLKPPTHSASGLPKRDAQFGYAAVQQTLEAIRGGRALPMLARQVLDKQQRTRTLSAVKQDTGGYMRCANCGQFASANKGHVCPSTTDSQTLGKHLHRRLGVSERVFGGGLDELLDQARANGSIAMRHGLTGEIVQATLDGLPLALATGFAPTSWQGKSQAVELADGRVVSVLDPSGLPKVQSSASAVANAGSAYGVVLGTNTMTGNAIATPPVSYHSVNEVATTNVSAGQAYDLAHFIGTEYRKKDAQGMEIEVNGQTYAVGYRSQEEADWSSARHAKLEPEPKGGVAVGRTLVEAVGWLSRGEVVETEDGKVQVYSAERRELLSVYDPATATAGDTLGTPNASAMQLAAVLAYQALHPQNGFDAALATDLVRARSGKGTPLAAADSAYIVMKNNVLAGDKVMVLGGQVGTSRCPKCGRFQGDAHICPAQDTDVSATPAFSAATTTVQPAMNIDVQVDTAPIADALRAAPSSQLSIDNDAFAQALSTGMSNLNIPTPTIQATMQSEDMSELKSAMTQMAQAIEAIAKNQSNGKAQVPEQLVAVTEKLAASLSSASMQTMAPTAAPSAKPGSSKCPKCGQFMADEHSCPPRSPRATRPVTAAEERTGQEHIFKNITMPAPDPYLMNVPDTVGGQLYQALEEFIPAVDPNFEINGQADQIMAMMARSLQSGANRKNSFWTRSFALYGPAGTGKNTIARQLAASLQTVDAEGNRSQGLNYSEANITPESSMQELIGTTVLEKDPETGATVSRTKLGKIGLAAAMGSVVCINEIVRSPKLATALQSMVEDGEIQIDSPEQGMIRIPVHPSTIFVVTWNPGYEGDADRPGQAPLSRIMPFRLDRPSADEQARRVESFFASLNGDEKAVQSIEERRKEILSKDYSLPQDIMPSREEIDASVRFFNEIATLSGGGVGERQIGLSSDTSTAPGQRQLNRFIALGKSSGWENALETLKIVCDQDDQFESQWSLVRERFEAHFGVDGQTFTRPAPEQN
jgi:hypothetical protein